LPASGDGFAPSPTSFALPAPLCQTDWNDVSKDNGTGAGYTLLDFTGDAVPDLVVFNDTCDATIGTTHWEVYAGSATGFAASPTSFALPAPLCQTSWDHISQESSTGASYTLMDLTGDGVPDLLVFDDACDATIGTTHWEVYAGSATGFAASPTSFALPAPLCQTNWNHISEDSPTGASYTLMDLTGDGAPDLLVFDDTCDATIGATHWEVYAGSPSGFAAAPTSFALPAPLCQTSWNHISEDSPTGASYALTDLTGDAVPDLVVFDDACDASIGTTHWEVYAGSPTGFAAAPTSFALPAALCQTSWDQLSQGSSTGASYTLANLEGGAVPDLVVFDDACDATIGTTHWEVYAGSATGFAAAPTSFALPAPLCQTSWNEVSQNPATGTGYALLNLTTSCAPSLVVFDDSCDGTIGVAHWEVYSEP